MKKIIFFIAGVAFAIGLGLGIETYTSRRITNETLLSNVEALTDDEDGTPGVVDKKCHSVNHNTDTIGCYVGNHGGHCHKHSDCPPV